MCVRRLIIDCLDFPADGLFKPGVGKSCQRWLSEVSFVFLSDYIDNYWQGPSEEGSLDSYNLKIYWVKLMDIRRLSRTWVPIHFPWSKHFSSSQPVSGETVPGWWSLFNSLKSASRRSQSCLPRAEDNWGEWVAAAVGRCAAVSDCDGMTNYLLFLEESTLACGSQLEEGVSLEILLGLSVNTKCYFWLTVCFLWNRKEGKNVI